MIRYGFVTCTELGFECIKTIYETNNRIEFIITLNDNLGIKKSGRIYLDDFCKKNKIKLFKCKNINETKCKRFINKYSIDWLFIVGWSQITKKKILNLPKKGCLGIHPTLLPVGRGRAPIPWTIIKKQKKTGATLFKLTEKVDDGPIGLQLSCKLKKLENASTLYDKIKILHKRIILKTITKLNNNKLIFKKQNHRLSSYWAKRNPEDGRINFNKSVNDAEILIRAITKPYPGAFVNFSNFKLVVWKAKKVKNFNGLVLNFKDGKLAVIDCEISNKFR